MSDFREAALRELQRLEQRLEIELAANPTYQQIRKLKAFLADYPDESGSGEAPKVQAPPQLNLGMPNGDVAASAASSRQARRVVSRKGKILALTGSLITSGGGRTTRQEIIQATIRMGLVPPDPKKAAKIVAPILSGAAQFETDGRGNWTEAKRKISPQGETGAVAAPASSSTH